MTTKTKISLFREEGGESRGEVSACIASEVEMWVRMGG